MGAEDAAVGPMDGCFEGIVVGSMVGSVGFREGTMVGSELGYFVGFCEGIMVGSALGYLVGACEVISVSHRKQIWRQSTKIRHIT